MPESSTANERLIRRDACNDGGRCLVRHDQTDAGAASFIRMALRNGRKTCNSGVSPGGRYMPCCHTRVCTTAKRQSTRAARGAL